MRLKAVATDVDFTLTDDRHLLDLDAVRVIRLLEGAGVPVILCSGRDLSALSPLGLYLGTSGLVVAEDGGLVGSMSASNFSLRPLADFDRVREALAALREAFTWKVQVVPLPARVVSYVLMRTLDRDEANALLARRGIEARLLDSGLAFELADAAVDKGRGLAEAAEMIGCDLTGIAAVGDSYNDIDMFRAVGWSAAVANAPDAVKAEATYACERSYGQGFVEAVGRAVSLFRPDLVGLSWPGRPAREEAGTG